MRIRDAKRAQYKKTGLINHREVFKALRKFVKHQVQVTCEEFNKKKLDKSKNAKMLRPSLRRLRIVKNKKKLNQ